jgi:PKD repeat protein
MKTNLFLIAALLLIQIVSYSETEPNNTMQQANNLPYNGSESGTLSGTDTEDWFVINVPSGGVFTLTVIKTGAGNGTLYLYDGDKPGIPEIKNLYMGYGDSPGNGWTLTIPVLKGKYYAKFTKSSDPVNYQVAATLNTPFYVEDFEPNDTITKALSISENGSVSGNLHYYAGGKGTDLEDWYKIQISQGGILNLKINKKGAGNTWLHFRDGLKPGNPEISQFYTGYSDSPAEGWSWSYPVLAGIYYFQVQGGDGIVDYKLDVSLAAPAYAEDTEPNDTIIKAMPMPVNGSVSGNIHYYVDGKVPDLQDWFKIEIPRGGILNLNIQKKGSGNTWIHFRDGLKTGNPEISQFYTGYSDSPVEGWSWSYPVLAGIYYFQVQGGDGIVDYKLDVSLATPAYTEDAEPNDTIIKALTMPVNGSVTGNLHYYINGKVPDLQDWFKIEIPHGGILNLKINKKGAGNTWIHFRDGLKTGNPEISQFYTGYSDSPAEGWDWSYPVLAGIYYFQIQGGDGIVDYKLDVSLAAPAYTEDTEPNDTIIKALTMPVNGSVTGNLHYYKNGKGSDLQDWFKIEIPKGGILTLNIQKKGTGNTWIHFRDGLKTGNPEISQFYAGYSDSPAEGWAWSYPVLAGIFYFNVEGGQGILDYKLDIKLVLPTWGEDTEPNDSIRFAQKFVANDSIAGILGYYKSGTGIDNWDWYYINTSEYGQLSFNIDKIGANNGNIHLRDSVNEIASQYLGFGDLNSTFNNLIPKGKYYLGFEKFNGDLQYKLRSKFTPKPKANFTISQTDHLFVFDNKTLYGESFEWNFDDETKTVVVNPNHEYLNPGNYNVCLIAKNVSGYDTICQKLVVPGLDRIYPNQAGNSGDVTVQVFGGGLDTLYHIRFEQNGVTKITSGKTGFGGKNGISATFDIRDQQIGVYDVVVEKKGGPSYIMKGSFTVTQGQKAAPWARLEGRNRILYNTTTTYKISYGNNGNVDATGVPLWIAISDIPGLTVEFPGINIKIPDYVYEKKLMDAYNSVDIFFRTDSIQGSPFKSRVYVFYIPVIPAGTTGQVTMKIKTDQNIKVMVWVNEPYFESPMKGSFAACVASVFAEGAIDAGTSAIPAVGCITQGIKSVYTIFSPFPGQPEQGNSWGSWLKGLAVSLVDCGISLTGVGAVVKAMGVLVANSYLYKEKLDDCRKAFLVKNPNEQNIAAVSSLDPNEKAGPTGFGEENYIATCRNIPYTIYFENKASATAPAHTVNITDQLDITKFDISTFNFGDIYIGDSLVLIKPGLKEFVVDKKLNNLNVVARISGKLDTLTGNVEWKLRSLDPGTLDDIEDPDIGLLPPNVNSPQGEGNVSFFVKLKSDPVHNFKVTNQASIVFDSNPAILTNKHLTTFDLNAPNSSVKSLMSTTTSKQFEVNWSGSDDGSGIEGYNIYVKTNDGPYNIWLSGATSTSAVFNSTENATYQFSSVAFDKTGNIETLPDIPDAITNVVTDVRHSQYIEPGIKVYPNSVNNEIIVNIGKSGSFRFSVFSSEGKLKFEKLLNGNSITNINTESLSQGLYLWQLIDQTSRFKLSGKFVTNK